MSEHQSTKLVRPLRNEIDFDSQAAVGARTLQEDYALFSTNPSGFELLAVLADGMGGHSAGDVASKRAVDAFHSTYNSYPPSSVPAKLSAALNQANNDLALCIKESPALSGMGCTLVGVHIGARGLHWISVGDSPLFLFRNGKIKRLNADHSMVPVIEESFRLGKITKKESLSHPDRHALRSAVSGGQLEMIDSSRDPLGLRSGDIVILASDGLLTLNESEISSVLDSTLASNAQGIVSALMKAVVAKNKPKQDNTTIQVFVAPQKMGNPVSNASLSWFLIGLVTLALVGVLAHTNRSSFTEFPKLPDLLDKPKVNVTPTPVQVPEPPSAPASPAETRPAPVEGGALLTKPTEQAEKPTGKAKPTAAESASKKKTVQSHRPEGKRDAPPAVAPTAPESSLAPLEKVSPSAPSAVTPVSASSTAEMPGVPAANVPAHVGPKGVAK